MIYPKNLFIVLLCVLSLSVVKAQNEHQLSITAGTGFGTGWWIWDKGSDIEAIHNNQGWARSHLSLMIPAYASLDYCYGKLRLSINGGTAWLYDDVLVNSNYQGRIQPKTLMSANSFLRYWQVSGGLGYIFDNGRRYRFTPIVALGTWNSNTILPGSENFKPRISVSLLLEQQISFGNLAIVLSPKYVYMGARVRNSDVYHEKHATYALGMDVGLRYLILKKVNKR